MMTPREAAETLVGTCDDFMDVVDVHIDELPAKWAAEFDELVARCYSCGYWLDTDDLDEDGNCADCEGEPTCPL